ncbi:hypothetical protein [Pseudanabaena sp. SR411]|nr:hypothetical protein [Pseudanabaena sp. SR411]
MKPILVFPSLIGSGRITVNIKHGLAIASPHPTVDFTNLLGMKERVIK